MVRGAYYDKNGVKRGAWSKEEDQRLTTYIQRFGHPNWRQLPKFAGLSRCGKSCRLRWVNYLRPNLKHGCYTPEEDELIIKLHQQHGNKWSLIAEKLPGRTDNQVKNHWHSHLKKRLNSNQPKSEIMKRGDDETCDIETNQPIESESSMPNGNASSSSNISESSKPNHTDFDAIYNNSWDFWTEPIILDNMIMDYSAKPNYIYAPNGYIDLDESFSFFFDNSEFLCQLMQEEPKDPERVYNYNQVMNDLADHTWMG